MKRRRRQGSPIDLEAKVAEWRGKAQALQPFAPGAAAAFAQCADELAAWAQEHALESLTLEQAVAESGYSYSTLQHMVADGALKNRGDKNRPRVRRSDLPRKVLTSAKPTVDLADRVKAARSGQAT